MTAKRDPAQRRSAWPVTSLLSLAVSLALVTSCSSASTEDTAADPPAETSDLDQVDGQTAHLECQGAGSPTLVFLGGMGFTTTTWAELRTALGPDVRTCASGRPQRCGPHYPPVCR
jgi:hypothetical protein